MLDISIDYVNGVEELWFAAYKGDVQKLEELLANPEFKSRINHSMNFNRCHSPLFFAIFGGHAAAVRVLLGAGADPLQRDNIGYLPLHYAANSLVKEVIDALLEVPNMKAYRLDDLSNTGLTPVHALFLASLGISQAIKLDYSNLARCLDSMLDPNRAVSQKAMEKTTKNGLSSFMFVKFFGLGSWFPAQHTPPKAFQVFLKNVIKVPGNIAALLDADGYLQSSEGGVNIEARLAIFAEAQRAKQQSALLFSAPEPVQDQQADAVAVTQTETAEAQDKVAEAVKSDAASDHDVAEVNNALLKATLA